MVLEAYPSILRENTKICFRNLQRKVGFFKGLKATPGPPGAAAQSCIARATPIPNRFKRITRAATNLPRRSRKTAEPLTASGKNGGYKRSHIGGVIDRNWSVLLYPDTECNSFGMREGETSYRQSSGDHGRESLCLSCLFDHLSLFQPGQRVPLLHPTMTVCKACLSLQKQWELAAANLQRANEEARGQGNFRELAPYPWTCALSR